MEQIKTPSQMKTLHTLLLFALAHALWGQSPSPSIDMLLRQSGYRLEAKPLLPPLRQIAGAPEAFYEHYWEFGDGAFSFEEAPVHFYQDMAEHEVLLLATGKYDDGKAPRSRKRSTQPKAKPNEDKRVAQALPHVFERRADALALKAVRNPSPGEETVLICSYTNRTPVPQSGELRLFFNQQRYPKPHFDWLEGRTHFGEQALSTTLAQAAAPSADAWAGTSSLSDWYAISLPATSPEGKREQLRKAYRSEKAWAFDGLMPGQARNFFVSLLATPDMLKDTNAIITITAMMATDDGRVVEVYPLELEVVASHDPNYIAVSHARMSYRGAKREAIDYKVHFQNTGEGPASRVEIRVDCPPGLDPGSLRLLETQPKVPICPDTLATWSCLDTSYQQGQLVLTFRNVYLPGTKQEGLSERDSTKGHIKYRLSPSRDLEKRPYSARAAIVFDRNPPIRTGLARTRFRPGLSPGLMAGWAFSPRDAAGGRPALGLSLAPFSPYRPFLQAELWASLPSEVSETERQADTVRVLRDIAGLPFVATVDTISSELSELSERSLRLGLAPLQLRLPLSDWASLGGGLMLDFVFRRFEAVSTRQQEVRVYRDDMELPDFYQASPPTTVRSESRSLELEPALFADLQLGRVRQGPALGLRGLLPLGGQPFWASAFLIWRF